MRKIRALLLLTAFASAFAPIEGMAMPLGSTVLSAAAPTMTEQVQYRRRPVVRGARGPVGAPIRRRGGGGGGAAAAIIGLGVLGAIAAGSAASAAPGRCWYERQRVYDEWGRYAGVQRVHVCN
jgi:hypothetical protein